MTGQALESPLLQALPKPSLRSTLDGHLQRDADRWGIHTLKPPDLVIEHCTHDGAMADLLAADNLHRSDLAQRSDQFVVITRERTSCRYRRRRIPSAPFPRSQHQEVKAGTRGVYPFGHARIVRTRPDIGFLSRGLERSVSQITQELRWSA